MPGAVTKDRGVAAFAAERSNGDGVEGMESSLNFFRHSPDLIVHSKAIREQLSFQWPTRKDSSGLIWPRCGLACILHVRATEDSDTCE